MIVYKLKKHFLNANAEEIEITSIIKEFIDVFVRKDCRFILVDKHPKFSIVFSGYKKDGIIKVFYDEIVENVSIDEIFEETYNVKLEKDYYSQFTDEIFNDVVMYDDNQLTGEFFEIIYT